MKKTFGGKQHKGPCVLCALNYRARHLRRGSADMLLVIDPVTREVFQIGKIE